MKKPIGELRASLKKLYRSRPDLWYQYRFLGELQDLVWAEHDRELYGQHIWDGTAEPIWKIFQALADKKWVGVEAATGVGKTWIAPAVIFWFLDCFDNALVVTTAPKKSQLKNVLWKEIKQRFGQFQKIRPSADIFEAPRIQVIPGDSNFADWVVIGEVAGVDAGVEVAQKMAGHHAENMLFVIDEGSGIAPSVLNAIVNTCTAENNLILSLGNPNSQTDPLHTFCMMDRVEHIRISGLDHPNVVLGKEVIPGAVSVPSIQMRAKEYGVDSHLYKSRVRGISPEQSENALVRASWIDDCIRNKIDSDHSANACGVDVANSNEGDKAAVAFGEANRLIYLADFTCPNANHLAYNLLLDDYDVKMRGYNCYYLPTLADYNIKAVGVDAVGVGVGTVNTFHDENFPVSGLQGGSDKRFIPADKEGKPLFSFNTLRDQMYWQARQDLQNCRINIDLKDQTLIDRLKKELTLPKYSTQTGKIKVESKEDIKKRMGGKSPNLADAFVYWNWVRHTDETAHDVFVGAYGGK